MKKYLFTALMLILSLTAFAQEEEITPKAKPTVFIESFTGIRNDNSVAVRNAIIAGIAKVGRVEMIDAQSESAGANEELRRTSNNISAGDDNVEERLGAIVRLGAEYYIKGNVDVLNAERKYKDNKYVSNATIVVTLKLIDPSKGKILETIQVTSEGTNYDGDNAKAIQDAISSLKGSKTERIVDTFFPIMAQIVDVDKTKKDAATFVYINAGEQHGVNKSLKFEVFSVKKIAGREARQKIGELRVEDIQGEDLSYCKVKNGGKPILEKFQAGEKLLVKSRPEENLIDKLGGSLGI